MSNFPQPSYPPEPETGEAKVITSEVTFCRFRPRFVSPDQKTVSKYKFFFQTVFLKNLTSSYDIFALLLLPLWHRVSPSVKKEATLCLPLNRAKRKSKVNISFFLPLPDRWSVNAIQKKKTFSKATSFIPPPFFRVYFPLARKNLGIGKNTRMKSKINNSGTVRKIRFLILSSFCRLTLCWPKAFSKKQSKAHSAVLYNKNRLCSKTCGIDRTMEI